MGSFSRSDAAAVARAIAAKLDGGRASSEGVGAVPHRVQGRWRERTVTVECWLGRGSTDADGWRVTTLAGGPPLTLKAFPIRPGERALIERGALDALTTGDEEVDAAWTLQGAPAATVKQLLDSDLLRALAALAKVIDPPAARLTRVGFDPPLGVAGGTVIVTSQGGYDAAQVMTGVELAVCAAGRLDALAGQRRAEPPTLATLAAEWAEIEVHNETFVAWARARWSWPHWIVVAILSGASWLTTNVSGVAPVWQVLVLLADLAAIAIPFFVWWQSRRRRLAEKRTATCERSDYA
jgi:hypothetical protein